MCDKDEGVFAPVKFGTDDKNAADFMGKLVGKDKIARSLNCRSGYRT